MEWKGLIKSMNDSKLLKYSDNIVAIIEDIHPKSEFHLLIIPYEDIPNIRSLRRCHVNIVMHMETVAKHYVSQNWKGKDFWLGFHAKPSMYQLHMHLITDDFNGHGFKNKKHWNSFTTPFFIPSSRVINDLQQFGQVNLPLEEACEMMLKSQIKCHKCNYKPINIPTLKLHLLTHSPFDV